jgi:amidase
MIITVRICEAERWLISLCARAQLRVGEEKAKRILPGMSTWINLLDYSASVLPVTLVDKNIDVVDPGYKPLNAIDEKIQKACGSPCVGRGKVLIILDDPELFDGAHVAVQVVGRRFQEERILAITEILGDALGKHVV